MTDARISFRNFRHWATEIQDMEAVLLNSLQSLESRGIPRFPAGQKMPLPLAQGAALNLPENLTEFTPQLASRGVPEIVKILVRSEFTLLQGSRRRRKHLYASPSAEREESKICVLLRDVRLVL